MKIIKLIRPITWLSGHDHGYANGYIALPKDHPWYEVDYEDIPVKVHGGLTFSEMMTRDDLNTGYLGSFEKVDEQFTQDDLIGKRVIGFDTYHPEDNQDNCDEEYVLSEIDKLFNQAIDAYYEALENEDT